jgi:hypothetical protein
VFEIQPECSTTAANYTAHKTCKCGGACLGCCSAAGSSLTSCWQSMLLQAHSQHRGDANKHLLMQPHSARMVLHEPFLGSFTRWSWLWPEPCNSNRCALHLQLTVILSRPSRDLRRMIMRSSPAAAAAGGSADRFLLCFQLQRCRCQQTAAQQGLQCATQLASRQLCWGCCCTPAAHTWGQQQELPHATSTPRAIATWQLLTAVQPAHRHTAYEPKRA